MCVNVWVTCLWVVWFSYFGKQRAITTIDFASSPTLNRIPPPMHPWSPAPWPSRPWHWLTAPQPRSGQTTLTRSPLSYACTETEDSSPAAESPPLITLTRDAGTVCVCVCDSFHWLFEQKKNKLCCCYIFKGFHQDFTLPKKCTTFLAECGAARVGLGQSWPMARCSMGTFLVPESCCPGGGLSSTSLEGGMWWLRPRAPAPDTLRESSWQGEPMPGIPCEIIFYS